MKQPTTNQSQPINLTNKEIDEVKKLLADLKTLNVPLKTFLTIHNHDNRNSSFIKDLNISGGDGQVLKINSEYIFLGKGIRLKNSADGLPDLGDEDLGVMFYNTTYDEVWVWRKNGASNEWKALAYVA